MDCALTYPLEDTMEKSCSGATVLNFFLVDPSVGVKSPLVETVKGVLSEFAKTSSKIT